MTRRTRRRGLAAVLCAVLALLLVASPAWAQDTEADPPTPPELLSITTADSSGGDDNYALVRASARPSEVDVTVNGVAAETMPAIPLSSSTLSAQTVIVIDNGVRAAGVLDEFIAAAVAYVRAAPTGEDIAVMSTGGAPRLRIGFNDNRDRTVDAIEAMVSSTNESFLWDAVRGAGIELRGGEAGLSNTLIFAGSADAGSVSSVAAARASLRTAQASAFTVALEDETVPVAALANVAGFSVAGHAMTSAVRSDLAAFGSTISELVAGTYLLPFESDALSDGQSIRVVVDGTTIEASFVPGTTTSGAALAPYVEPGSSTLPFLTGDNAKTVGLILGAVSAALAAWAIASLFEKDPSGLNSVLQVYADPYGAQTDEDEGKFSFAKNLFVKRAVEITEGFAERRGVLVRAENALERADLPLRAGEAFTVYAGIVLAGFVVGLVLGQTLIAGMIFCGFAAMVPPAIVNFMAARRRKAFMGQLPDTLQLLSSTLKAGYSFMQGVEAVSQEVDDPMGGELRRVVTEAQLGRPVEEALDASAERMDSPDFAWAVMAVKIQREVGGNLSELLMTVAETMTARERLRRDVAALTAEGKMSAIVLGALPILLGFAMYAMNPEYIGTLFNESIGKILLGTSVVSALIGFAWMKKIINIDI